MSEIEWIEIKIRTGCAEFMWSESNSRKHYMVSIKGQKHHVVYNSILGALTTLLVDTENIFR
jgi:hypothetical protein